MKVSYRPHHFLCTLAFQGMGYSPKFVKNFQAIVDALRENEELSIEVVSQTDSICSACPHKRKQKCTEEEKIQSLDARHKDVLKLEQGQVLNWKQAKDLIRQHMTLDQFHAACDGCNWKSLGVCETALKKLREEDGAQKADP